MVCRLTGGTGGGAPTDIRDLLWAGVTEEKELQETSNRSTLPGGRRWQQQAKEATTNLKVWCSTRDGVSSSRAPAQRTTGRGRRRALGSQAVSGDGRMNRHRQRRSATSGPSPMNDTAGWIQPGGRRRDDGEGDYGRHGVAAQETPKKSGLAVSKERAGYGHCRCVYDSCMCGYVLQLYVCVNCRFGIGKSET